MEPVDFYKLPRAAQERFVGSVKGSGLPAPIVSAPFRPRTPLLWLAGSAACFVLLIIFACAGYGNLASGLAREGAFFAVLDVTFAALMIYAVLRAVASMAEHDASPYPRGLYVFPVGLIDARTPTLRVYPIDSLGGVFGPDVRGMTLEFEGTPFSFPVRDAETAANVRTEIDRARGSIKEAGSARESIRPKALAALDPLQGYANPLASSEAMQHVTPQWVPLAWAIAAVAGFVLGGFAWMVRNAKSDDATYAHAVAANDGDSYRAYLAKGVRHAAEVGGILLPRALLREAVAEGTVAAVEKFIAENPRTSIANEAAAALRSALLSELDVAVKAGTLAALDDFTKRHPAAHLDAELARARHGVYAAALERYTKEAPDKSVAGPFMERLLHWAETKGPRVEVRFHHPKSKTLDKADAAVGRNAQFRGVVSLPSHYFDDAAEHDDREGLTAAVRDRFAAVFPPEILLLVPADPVAETDAPLSVPVTSPTLFIEAAEVWGGSIQASRAPRGVFVGLELSLDAFFRLPDATRPLHVKVAAWHAPNVNGAKDSDAPERAVYKEMRGKAFEPFQKKLLGTFFRAGP